MKPPAGGVACRNVTAPAGQGVVRLEGAIVIPARADLLEAPGRRGGLALIVIAPAGQGVVRLEGAIVIPARADLLEAPGRRGGLAVIVISPAGQGVVRLDGATVFQSPALTCLKLPAGGVAWPYRYRPSRPGCCPP